MQCTEGLLANDQHQNLTASVSLPCEQEQPLLPIRDLPALVRQCVAPRGVLRAHPASVRNINTEMCLREILVYARGLQTLAALPEEHTLPTYNGNLCASENMIWLARPNTSTPKRVVDVDRGRVFTTLKPAETLRADVVLAPSTARV